MKKEELSYIYLLLFHAFLGFLVFALPVLSKIYTLTLFAFGIYYIVMTKNKNNEALVMSAYIVSVEVLLRMTDGMLLNEFGKYSIMIFMFLGMVFSGFYKSSWVYWIFLLFLIPGIILASISFNFNVDVRKAIAFNISGPVCLGISAIYCFQRKITFDRLKGVITAFSLPLISLLVYLYLYNPSVKDVITGTQSNFETSGGFGPNQVSTILGLGTFVFFVQLLLNSKSRLLQIMNAGLLVSFAFRGLVTFSRGGMISAVAMILILLVVLFFKANLSMRPKIGLVILFSFITGLGIWGYSSLQTNGLINKRYANQDAAGREKKDRLGGREQIMNQELNIFIDNPIIGIGTGMSKYKRAEITGMEVASHNEITRMLVEHGLFGLIDLMILFFTPLLLFVNNRQNVFALSFFVFWLLTINHAAMRLAAPAFVYALSLLKVSIVEEPTLHRK